MSYVSVEKLRDVVRFIDALQSLAEETGLTISGRSVNRMNIRDDQDNVVAVIDGDYDLVTGRGE